MFYFYIIVLTAFGLVACTKNSLNHVTEEDFHPESEVGIYDISEDECALMIYRKIIIKDSPIGCERLKKVVFEFYPLAEERSSETEAKNKGALIVLDVVADNVLALFNELYQRQFPIKSAIPIEYFSKKERKTEDMNNSLAFDSRPITDGSKWSEHAYGVAIDINPLQNPYLYIDQSSKAIVVPEDAKEGYLNRAKYRVGKPLRVGMSEDVATVFAKHGFAIWGGDWNIPIDYMHFQIGSRQFIEHLVALPLEEANALFRRYVKQLNQCFQKKGPTDNVALLRKSCVEQVSKAFETI
ncbi:M15 family metallopeptidase [Microbulbifer variabilis]|uniref:M15 family metallopeptidase n=1 Tax=Microbulbifer variabilis TaxID=266805 RepID=UPI001CFE6B9A|nr:M15 family metallopeptidase [Microbulbifer variabilis]